ncbi:hypothetical protein PsYK624_098710 [Phanerochaete sordida]|uniref:Heterokaryon incompatibility domain-containing protein n=1 Tax=Phanerochaete sordida TaxID=48140 RepID=A0A9P3GF60_9APHY|nr:hypothetical protein PsYK624_098710 [Phanerochaete sordida]
MSRMSIVTKTQEGGGTVPMDYTDANEDLVIPTQQAEQEAEQGRADRPITPDEPVYAPEDAIAAASTTAPNVPPAWPPLEQYDKLFRIFHWLSAHAEPVDESETSVSAPHAYLRCPGRCCPANTEEDYDQEVERKGKAGESWPLPKPGYPMGPKDIKGFAGAVWNDAFQGLLDDVLLNARLICPEESISLPWHCLLDGRKRVERCCERPPWSTNGRTCFVVLPRYVEHRVEEKACPSDVRRNRDRLWASMQLAVSGAVPEERLFVGAGKRHSYTLRPSPRSCVPLQWVHRSAFAISTDLANLRCPWLGENMLLSLFSDIVGVPCNWQTEEMRQCFQHVRRTARDFGEAYGILRPHFRWIQENGHSVEAIPFEAIIQRCQKKDDCWVDLNEANAIDGESAARPQPRRVWDLYSNRVLPFHLACPANYNLTAPWLVTDIRGSAVRDLVKTRINSEQWSLSVPHDTSLEHVRVELLNMGAEYVWLAELCVPLRGREGTGPLDLGAAAPDVKAMVHLIEREGATHILYPCGLGVPTSLSRFDGAFEALRALRGVWAYEKKWGCWLPGGLIPTAAHDVTATRLLFDEELRRGEVISSRVVQAMNVVPAIFGILGPRRTLEAFGFVPDQFLRD